MNKSYNRIRWENFPSEKTPVNEENLNKLDYATDEIDNRVITLDTTKATKTEVATMIADVSFNETTGIFTFTRKNGATFTVDTLLEKIIINFDFDRDAQKLIITMEDGTKKEIDLSVFITQYEFVDSDTVAFTVDNTGKVTAIVKEGSIQEKHLRPDYLADIKVESAKAEASATAAKTSEENAESSAEDAEAWAIGKRGGVNVPAADETYENNSKYYSEQSKSSSDLAKNYVNEVEEKGKEAVEAIENAYDMSAPEFQVDLETGHLLYQSNGRFVFNVNNSNGHLEWGMSA